MNWAPARARRRRAVRFGRLGEAACRWRLRLCGWRIVARNWRVPVGEIDIIATRGRVVAFIEVKARRARGGDAAEALASRPGQRRRIGRAAEMYLARHPEIGAFFGRFDVMLVGPAPTLRFFWPTHLTDAWRMGDGRMSDGR
ncbi:MAG: YraN family protein [Alphaproteobacteria bacterium]|jgi:putative endonuclease|nr:YraN family protein [Alphaproteobacteria bacterium]MDP6516055.1 YraN family protein [Alphaproteobacteria bacterium]